MHFQRKIKRNRKSTAFCLILVFALHFFSGWVSWWHESKHHIDAHEISLHNHCAHKHSQETSTSSLAFHEAAQDEHAGCLLCNQNWLPIWPSITFFNQSPHFQFEGIKTDNLEFYHYGVAVFELSDRAPPVC